MLKSIISFLVVGALSALIYFSIFGFFWQLLHLNYNIAVSIAYGAAVLFHFTANRKITFKNPESTLSHQIPRYMLVITLNYLITLTCMYFVVTQGHLSPYLGILTSILVTTFTSYTLLRCWVFALRVKI